MNLEECTLVELRQLAKERGIKYVSKIKKDELIKLLSAEKEDTESNENNQNSDTAKQTNNHVSEHSNNDETNNETTEENKENEEKDTVQEVEVRYVDGYKLTSPDDKISEGILEILPDGYGFLRGKNYLSTQMIYIFHLYK